MKVNHKSCLPQFSPLAYRLLCFLFIDLCTFLEILEMAKEQTNIKRKKWKNPTKGATHFVLKMRRGGGGILVEDVAYVCNPSTWGRTVIATSVGQLGLGHLGYIFS